MPFKPMKHIKRKKKKNTIDTSPSSTHLVVAGHIRHAFIVSSQLVLDLVDGVILNVYGSDEHIVGDVVQVAAEFQPGPSSTDVVSGALSLHLQHQEEKKKTKQSRSMRYTGSEKG